MNSNDIAIVAVFGISALLATVLLLRPVFRAWARRLEAGAGGAEQPRELSELRERVAQLEEGHGRLQELEERVDFAERMLAQRPDAIAMPLHRTPT